MVVTPHMLRRTCANVLRKTRKLKQLNIAFNNVTTPINFCELSFEDIPDYVPYHRLIMNVLNKVPNLNVIGSCYDTFAIDKDMIENIMCVLLNTRKFAKLSDKNKLLTMCKIVCLIYKLLVYNTNLHTNHTDAVVGLDYINFVFSCID